MQVADRAQAVMRYFIVRFGPGPAWRQGVDVFGQPLDEHVEYLNQLYAADTVVMAGPLADGSGGLTILQCGSAEYASTLVERDPAVRSGILDAEIREWRPIAWGFEPVTHTPYQQHRLKVSVAGPEDHRE